MKGFEWIAIIWVHNFWWFFIFSCLFVNVLVDCGDHPSNKPSLSDPETSNVYIWISRVRFSASSTVPQLNAIPSQQQLTTTTASLHSPSTSAALSAAASADLKRALSQGLKLEEIRVPPVASLAGSSIKVPTTKEQLIELVAVNGDGYEENLISQFNRNDLSQPLRWVPKKPSGDFRNPLRTSKSLWGLKNLFEDFKIPLRTSKSIWGLRKPSVDFEVLIRTLKCLWGVHNPSEVFKASKNSLKTSKPFLTFYACYLIIINHSENAQLIISRHLSRRAEQSYLIYFSLSLLNDS